MKIEQIGTLEELDVKPGDVVECSGRVYDVVLITNETKHPRRSLCDVGDVCALSRDGKKHQSVNQSTVPQWKIIRRATPKPSIDLTAIREPFGLLDKATQDALIAHGGPYQLYEGTLNGWRDVSRLYDDHGVTYRVKPSPKRETVTKEMRMTPTGVIQHNDGRSVNCTITYDLVDGQIDIATYKVTKK